MDKRDVRRAAARLRNLGRVVPVGRSDEERLSEAQQAARNEDTYQEAAACTACTEARQKSGDETALCPEHLARALGLGV